MVGDTVRQTLSGYDNVDIFTVLDITRETDDMYEVTVYSFWDPPGVAFEFIEKKYIEQEYYQGSISRLRTEIL